LLNRTPWLLGILALLGIGFGVGVVRLVQMRFEAGDIYPPYSSFRADPLGTKALYDSLAGLRGVRVRRHLRQIPQLPPGRDTTLFLCGADLGGLEAVPDAEFRALETFLQQGGRIVVTFPPVGSKPWGIQMAEGRAKRAGSKNGARDAKSDPRASRPTTDRSDEDQPEQARRRWRRLPIADDARRGVKTVSLHEQWGVEFGYASLDHDEAGAYAPVRVDAVGDGALPPSLKWHTALYFDKLATHWSTLYRRDEHPVLVERKQGRGSLVLAADSYLVSNEALRQDRQPALLAWLIGSNRGVVFDETHLGVREEPGVAALIRQYRLHGLVAGLVLLAGLFVWKNAARFLPVQGEESGPASEDSVVGRDSAAGFVNLLRRSLAPSEIVAVCLNEWTRSCGRSRTGLGVKAERMASLVDAEQARPAWEQRPVETYRQIAALSQQPSGHRAPGTGPAGKDLWKPTP
jgi:hypothetical protein